MGLAPFAAIVRIVYQLKKSKKEEPRKYVTQRGKKFMKKCSSSRTITV